MKIILFAPSYDNTSGGIIVMHKLCDLLIKEGFNAGFFIDNKNGFLVNSNYKYQSFRINDINPDKDIVIYPEIILGNPLKVKNVVRYILNRGHVTLNRKDTWGENDYWVYYSKRFYDGIKPFILLNIDDPKLDYFKDYKIDRVYKECFTYRKKHDRLHELNIIHSKDAIEIGFNTPDETLINIFNQCERFYCYDTESYLNVLASLCGCDSIVVPNNKVTRDEVMKKSPAFAIGGVAYGIEEIQHARDTRHLLVDYLKEKEQNQTNQVNQVFTQIIKHFQNAKSS